VKRVEGGYHTIFSGPEDNVVKHHEDFTNVLGYLLGKKTGSDDYWVGGFDVTGLNPTQWDVLNQVRVLVIGCFDETIEDKVAAEDV